MQKYDCCKCINLHSPLCSYCTVTKVPSGKEQKPRHFIRATEIGTCADGKIPEFIKDCIDRGKSISTAVIIRYNKDLETKQNE